MKILAISGGVDSMVMLDILMQKFPASDLLVAHFDHGIRNNSRQDAEFVQRFCLENNLKCVIGRGDLGPDASEELARKKRYEFLFALAREYSGKIYTAHHLDDLVESVAINFARGTGWRGLAVLNNNDIERPFLNAEFCAEIFGRNSVQTGAKNLAGRMTNNTTENLADNSVKVSCADRIKIGPKIPSKKDLLIYAGQHNLRFREDQSNNSEEFLRNRVRELLADFPEKNKLEILALWQKQVALKSEIDTLVQELLPEKTWPRNWFDELDQPTALELLRAGTLRAGISATRPQLLDFLEAIKTYAPAKKFNLPGDNLIRLGKKDFNL